MHVLEISFCVYVPVMESIVMQKLHTHTPLPGSAVFEVSSPTPRCEHHIGGLDMGGLHKLSIHPSIHPSIHLSLFSLSSLTLPSLLPSLFSLPPSLSLCTCRWEVRGCRGTGSLRGHSSSCSARGRGSRGLWRWDSCCPSSPLQGET